jgi:hypothetical protein
MSKNRARVERDIPTLSTYRRRGGVGSSWVIGGGVGQRSRGKLHAMGERVRHRGQVGFERGEGAPLIKVRQRGELR